MRNLHVAHTLERAAAVLAGQEEADEVSNLGLLSMMTMLEEDHPSGEVNDTADVANPQNLEFVPADPAAYMKAVGSHNLAGFIGVGPEDLVNLKIFCLTEEGQDTGIYYAITKEGEVTGVVNSGPYKGIAAREVIRHAPKHGGTWLNCWDVGGKLPTIYGKVGWKKYETIPYDAETYGPPPSHVAEAWRKAGWKDGDPYPSVVYMKI